MRMLFSFTTGVGTFYIGEQGGRYFSVFRDVQYGNYARPEQVAEDLSAGRTLPIPGVPDTATLGIPADLAGWVLSSGR